MFKQIKTTAAAMLFLVSAANAQLTISSGAVFNIQTGALVTVQGDVLSSADITGAGKVVLKGSANQNVNMNGFTIPNLEMDNAANATLTGNAQIGTDVTFTNGKIQHGNFDIKLASAATVTGADATKYFVTNGTGKLVKSSLGAAAFTYPVGNTVTTYNPAIISNSGTADDIGVRSLANALTTGTTGAAFTKEVADASWDVSEAVAGGSNLSLTATWTGTDELAGFNRNKGGISYYIPTPGATQGWDMLNTQTGVASGANPYTYTRTGITAVGAFAVGTRPVLSPLLVSPKVFLQGPYNVGAGLMTDGLRTLNLIPTTEPYTGFTGFTHTVTGSGGGETSTASVVGSAAAAGGNAVVDWVFAQLHDGASGVVVGTRAALLQRDGDIVDTDGTSPLNMAGFPAGNYYVSVRHRNHLGARTAAAITGLAKNTTTVYDFTTAVTQAFPGAVLNAPMATLTGSIFGLFAGNANDDLTVKMTGVNANSNDYLKLIGVLGNSANSIPNTYSKQDLNMDGTVKMTGVNASTNDYLRLLGALGSSINSLTQPGF
jgi:hypothetical protein